MTERLISPSILAGLLLTPVLISAGQLLFKQASTRLSGNLLLDIQALATSLPLITALVIYGFGTLVWVFTIRSVPLTTAYPFMALTFVLVPLFAYLGLGEAISARTVIGSAIIMFGLIVISR